MEAELRGIKSPFSLESKKSLREFDILGFTLPYESIYTNVLNILNLAGIPARSVDRAEDDPLILGGGQACFNPEPMADFFDAFAIGEGEEVSLEISRVYQNWKNSSRNRSDLLLDFGAGARRVRSIALRGFLSSGWNHCQYHPKQTTVPEKITSGSSQVCPLIHPNSSSLMLRSFMIACQLNHARLHTRLSFCHAGMVSRPVRQRSVDEIIPVIDEALASTGFEEVGLLSLSSSDHTQILDLTKKVQEKYHDRKLAFSLPSSVLNHFRSVDG